VNEQGQLEVTPSETPAEEPFVSGWNEHIDRAADGALAENAMLNQVSAGCKGVTDGSKAIRGQVSWERVEIDHV
jgi:hypothetical protein